MLIAVCPLGGETLGPGFVVRVGADPRAPTFSPLLLDRLCVRLRFVAVDVFVVYLLPLSGPPIFRKRGRWAQMSDMLLFENDQFGKDLFLFGNYLLLSEVDMFPVWK